MYMKMFAVIWILICAMSHPVCSQWVAQNSGTNVNFYDIEFLNDRIVWSVREAGVVIKTTNGGTNRFKNYSRQILLGRSH